MSRLFKVFVTMAITIASAQAFSHFKPALAKVIQASPVSSRTLGPPKGIVSAQELIDSREATLLFKGEAHEVKCQPVLPEMIAKIRHPEPYVLHLPKARVYGDNGVVIAPLCDKILDDSVCECSGNLAAHPVFSQLSLSSALRITGRSALITAESYQNYYHWMINILPKIALLQTKGIDVDHYLLPAASAPYMKESLEMLGLGCKIRFLEAQSHYECDELIYPSQPCRQPTVYTPRWVCQWLRKAFYQWRKSGKVYCKHIIVSRSKAHGKHMVNEEELVKRLTPYGFVSVHLEDMPLEDQIGHFSQAEIVIATHGSSLTNLVFAGAGTKVIEIFPPHQGYTPSYTLLCQMLRLDHTPIFIQEANVRSKRDYTVDVDRIEQMVWCMMQDSGIQIATEDGISLLP